MLVHCSSALQMEFYPMGNKNKLEALLMSCKYTYICLIDKIHLVFGNIEDLSALDPHWVFSNECFSVEKKGGGK